MNDFSAMALLRQYSLLGLPHTWKASLIHSYGSLLAQNQADQFSRSPFFRGWVPPGPNPHHPTPTSVPPIAPNLSLPNPNVAPFAPSSQPPPLPPPPAAQTSSSPHVASRKAAVSGSPRSSPNTSGGQTKQRTYPCNECGKVFNAHYNLTRHMPVHTGKKLDSLWYVNIYIYYYQNQFQGLAHLYARSVVKVFVKHQRYAVTKSSTRRKNLTNAALVERLLIAVRR